MSVSPATRVISLADFERLLAIEIEKTSKATTTSLLNSPLIIRNAMYPILEASSDFFHQGEWQVRREDKRFLATVSVLTCIALFAWTDKGRKGGGISTADEVIAFGAHIDAEYYFGSKRFHQGDGYAFLRKLLKSAFGETDPRDIHCHLVGDHLRGAPGATSKDMGVELVESLRSANYQVHTDLFKIFPGATVQEWTQHPMETNFSLYRSNQCFFFVAMDCETGKLIAHTRYYDESNPAPMWRNMRTCEINIQGSGCRQFNANILLKKSSGSHLH